jgi:hypothetical protein
VLRALYDGLGRDGLVLGLDTFWIILWEAWSHAHGWAVDTPRIPGLRYPTWAELQARWAGQHAELEPRSR